MCDEANIDIGDLEAGDMLPMRDGGFFEITDITINGTITGYKCSPNRRRLSRDTCRLQWSWLQP